MFKVQHNFPYGYQGMFDLSYFGESARCWGIQAELSWLKSLQQVRLQDFNAFDAADESVQEEEHAVEGISPNNTTISLAQRESAWTNLFCMAEVWAPDAFEIRKSSTGYKPLWGHWSISINFE